MASPHSGRSLRTPLGRVRYLGAARSGTLDAARMRATSAALIPLTIGFVWLVLTLLPLDYNGVRASLSHPIPAILMLLFVLAGVWHMQIGMRSVILDYIHAEPWKEWTLLASSGFCVIVATSCVYAILRIGFT